MQNIDSMAESTGLVVGLTARGIANESFITQI